MKVSELKEGNIYIPKEYCFLYTSPMEPHYYLARDESEQANIPQGITFVSVWAASYKSPNAIYATEPILYLGSTRENWTIDHYYYRCYKFHWGLVRGKKSILNFHSIQNLTEAKE